MPSTLGREGNGSRPVAFPGTRDSRTRCRRFPLFPGERAGVRAKAPSDHQRPPICRILLASALGFALGLWGIPPASAQVTQPRNGTLAFSASGTNEFTFDTGVLKGKLRADGKSKGLSSVVHLPTGLTLDSSMGLFGHYRVFSTNHRYSTAAWDWPSEARLRLDGSVEVHWPPAEDRPFELRAIYRWAAPDTLDLETIVQANADLPKFESFLASYFSECFTNAAVYVRSNSQVWFAPADKTYGVWQAFPRDDRAVSITQDGRWKIPPNPVDWVIRPRLASPLAVRSCPAIGLRAVLMSPPSDCFGVLTPFEGEGHRSMYLSLFGKDLKAGETTRARARLMIVSNLPDAEIVRACETYLKRQGERPREP
jgi:hypothetical protein